MATKKLDRWLESADFSDKGETFFSGIDSEGRAVLEYISSWRKAFGDDRGRKFPLRIHLNRQALLIRKKVRGDLGLDVGCEISALSKVTF